MEKKIFTTAMLSCFLSVAFCQTGTGKIKKNDAGLNRLTVLAAEQKVADKKKLEQASLVATTPDRQAAEAEAAKLKKTAQHN